MIEEECMIEEDVTLMTLVVCPQSDVLLMLPLKRCSFQELPIYMEAPLKSSFQEMPIYME